jgi:hypothetical protein
MLMNFLNIRWLFHQCFSNEKHQISFLKWNSNLKPTLEMQNQQRLIIKKLIIKKTKQLQMHIEFKIIYFLIKFLIFKNKSPLK